MAGDIEEIQQRRADLALDVLDGIGDVTALEAVEGQLAEAARWSAWEAAADQARTRRDAERREDEREAMAHERERLLRDTASERLRAAEQVEKRFEELTATIEDYVACDDVLGDRGRPLIWWLQWKLSSRFRRDFPRPPAPQRVGLVEGERERLKMWLPEEQADER